MPEARYGAASTSYGDELYIFGGVGPDERVRTETFSYNPWLERWRTDRAPLPVPRQHAAAVVYGDRIYVIGGSNGTTPSDSVFAYLPSEDRWVLAGRLQTAREGCAAVVWRDNIYVLGGAIPGEAETSYLNEIEIFDTVVGRGIPLSIGLPDPPRANFAAVAFGGNLYVFGGMYFGPLALVDVLVPEGLWRRLPGLRTPRAFASAIATPYGVYVTGGEGFSGELRSVEILPVYAGTNQCEYDDSLNVPRAEAAAAYVGDFLVVAGGRGGGRALSTVEMLPLAATSVRGRDRVPATPDLHGPYPNPFSQRTTLTWAVRGGRDRIRGISAFDCLGRKVRTLNARRQGEQLLIQWDGRDERGRPVPRGIYVIRIRTTAGALARKVVYAP